MQLIKGVFFTGLLLVIVAASIFAMHNRGMFKGIRIDQATAFSGFFENVVRPKLPGPLAKMFPTPTPLAENASPSAAVQISINSEDAKNQLTTLSNRGQLVGQEVGKVLGDQIKVNEEDANKPLHEKALEYGQYLYCQQVVKEYEATATPSAH